MPPSLLPHSPGQPGARHGAFSMQWDFGSARLIWPACLSIAAVALSHLWQGRYGFSLWDEGFLWYGVQRVMAGEVPIRDFMAYDPGRYYWSAALMAASGDGGIVAVRAAAAVFQALGLFVGLRLVARATVRVDAAFWTMAALVLFVWMFPRHKLFDVSVSLMLIGMIAFLMRAPSPRRFFPFGIAVGLAAVFGRNHGLYGLAGGAFATTYLAFRDRGDFDLIPCVAAAIGGLVVGYLPVLIMIAAVPGFAASFWESIRFLFEIKGTNLPLPVPWPWRVLTGALAPVEAARGVATGLLFVAILVFGVGGLAWLAWQAFRRRPVAPELAAALAMALPYGHYAFSRADTTHLAQGIFPLLVGGLVLMAGTKGWVRWPAAALFAGASLLIVAIRHPGAQCRLAGTCVAADVGGSRLIVDPATAADVSLLTTLAGRFAPAGRSFVAMPFWPGAYAVLGRRSPVWEIYALLPRSPAFQRAEIARIEAARPGFAIILDLPLDGSDALRFRNTHPELDAYVRDRFVPVMDVRPGPAYQIYRDRPSR